MGKLGVEENTSKAFVSRSEPPPRVIAPLASANTGSALFVINLCASQAPASNVAKSLPGLDGYRLFQVSRVEDGRTRYRLRLGFFTSEADAENVLATVRVQYPTAFTTCLCDEDRKFTRGYDAVASMPKPVAAPQIAGVAPVRAPTAAAASTAAPAKLAAPAAAMKSAPAAKPAVAAAVAKAAVAAPAAETKAKPAAVAEASKTAAKAAPPPAPVVAARPPAADSEIIELTWEPEEVPAPAVAAEKKTQPATPAKVATPTPAVVTEFHWEPPATDPKAVNKPAAKPIETKAVEAKPAAKPAAKAVETKPAAKVAEPLAAKPDAGKLAKAAPTKADKEKSKTIELTLESEPKAAPAPAAVKPATDKPFHVGKGVEIPAVGLSLETGAMPAAAVSKATEQAKQQIAAKANAPAPSIPAPAELKPLLGKAKAFEIPDLDSTQTIRALTAAELNDDAQEKWFSIQLAISDQPVNLDAMPRLDIFEAYRLYSVANAGSGKIAHYLRVGFFREEVSAEAVSGYLKTFFGSPTVVRISIAEHSRFKDPPGTKAKPATSARSDAKVVDLTHARDRAKPVVPTVTMEVTPGPTADATGSFDMNATGSFKTDATGSFKPNATGAFKPNATGSFKASANATGKHKALSSKPAAKASGTATKRSGPPTQSTTKDRNATTGKHRVPTRKLTLQEELLNEAREVALSESGIRKLPKSDSLLSRLVGKLTK
jgi:hypothetical protein